MPRPTTPQHLNQRDAKLVQWLNEAYAAVTRAKRSRREEERMAKCLTAELPRLVKDVVRAEIPRDRRASAVPSRRRPPSRRATASTAG